MAAAEVIKKRPVSASVERSAISKKSRYSELSLPKQSKQTWYTTEPYLVWGNQEPMWPLSQSALKARASPRVKMLATPKKNHSIPDTYKPEFFYGCGRASQIWRVSPYALHTVPTWRIGELSRHKTLHQNFIQNHPQFVYSCGRESVIWDTSRTATTYPSRPHTTKLAKPKTPHPDYKIPKPVQTVIKKGNIVIPPGTADLAKHKTRLDGPFREPEWKVSEAAKQAAPTERVQELAKPKKVPEGYEADREVVWKVGTGTLNAVTSNRMEELAKPTIRDTMDHLQFNPEAFIVSELAKRAKPSPRIEVLAEPIKRGT